MGIQGKRRALLAALVMMGAVVGGSLLALGWVTIHHLQWMEMRRPMAISVWDWLALGGELALITGGVARLAWAAGFHIRRQRLFYQKISRYFIPAPEMGHLMSKLKRDRVDWYQIRDEARYAMTFGWSRPRIVVSSGLWNALNSAQRHAVLSHELGHVITYDYLWDHAFLVAIKAFPHGFFRRLYAHFVMSREFVADALSVSAMQGQIGPLVEALNIAASAGHETNQAGTLGWNGMSMVRVAQLKKEGMDNVLSPIYPTLSIPMVSTCIFLAGSLALWC